MILRLLAISSNSHVKSQLSTILGSMITTWLFYASQLNPYVEPWSNKRCMIFLNMSASLYLSKVLGWAIWTWWNIIVTFVPLITCFGPCDTFSLKIFHFWRINFQISFELSNSTKLRVLVIFIPHLINWKQVYMAQFTIIQQHEMQSTNTLDGCIIV